MITHIRNEKRGYRRHICFARVLRCFNSLCTFLYASAKNLLRPGPRSTTLLERDAHLWEIIYGVPPSPRVPGRRSWCRTIPTAPTFIVNFLIGSAVLAFHEEDLPAAAECNAQPQRSGAIKHIVAAFRIFVASCGAGPEHGRYNKRNSLPRAIRFSCPGN